MSKLQDRWQPLDDIPLSMPDKSGNEVCQFPRHSCGIGSIQGQARGYGHITSLACRPHGANTSNCNNSLMAQYF